MDNTTARQRFLSYVRSNGQSEPVVSPFLPYADVIQSALGVLGLPVGEDPFANEIRLARHLDYVPMFMTQMGELLFPWKVEEQRSDEQWEVSVLPLREGEWVRRIPRRSVSMYDESCYVVRTREDHERVRQVCERVGEREEAIRRYFADFRRRVGEEGVIVIGHPHPSWLGSQISPQNTVLHWHDHREQFIRSMDALTEASLFVMQIALSEGIDFMSDSSYGLEMISPELFEAMDLPYIRRFADWTHERGGLFWYHNCGDTRRLILEGYFDRMGADLIETLAEPPEGDNDLRESRHSLDRRVCSKGNLNLTLLRDGRPEQIAAQARRIVEAVTGYAHVVSTADAVLPGTPGENYIAFVEAALQAQRQG
jgi:hypothetical protein